MYHGINEKHILVKLDYFPFVKMCFWYNLTCSKKKIIIQKVLKKINKNNKVFSYLLPDKISLKDMTQGLKN